MAGMYTDYTAPNESICHIDLGANCSHQTMEGLINQAFVHINTLGTRVQDGHYDLEGPEGELILKDIWDTTVQPGWQITMKMWPEDQHRPRHPQQIHFPPGMTPEQRREFIQNLQRGRAVPRPMPGMPGPMGRPPVPPFGAVPPGGHGPMPPGVEHVIPGRGKRDGRKKAPKPSFMGALFGAPQPKKSSSKKYERPSSSLLLLLCCCW